MSRIGMIRTDGNDPLLKSTFEAVLKHVKVIPNLYRVLGHSPEMLRAWVNFAWSIRLKATTVRPLREIMILRGAQLTKTGYEWAHHVAMARQAGVPQAKIDALEDWQASSHFDAKERAALLLTEEITRGPGASPFTLEDLRRHFSDAEVVELVLTASFYVCVSRILNTFDVKLEDEYANLRPRTW